MTSRDFPTAAEAANEKQRRAAALAAKQKLIEERAAAAAAKNAELLQNLDAFRGIHLDPNAHHWDEDVRLSSLSFVQRGHKRTDERE